MRALKINSILNFINSYLVDSPQPANINYWWNVGSLLALSLGIQIVTGITLAMHYNPSVVEAFNSVEHIMRDVNNGWFIRYLHSNTASAFFFLVYLHIGRGLYYGSYRAPRTIVWAIGTIILILMMATAFLGYVLPYGQMSLWGATVITNLMSAIPWIGQDIVQFVWGGFSVNNATLNRFFSLHFVLPFILAGLALVHLVSLHDTAGSGNPLGTSGNYDRVSFSPHYIFKDTITIYMYMGVVSMFVFFFPNFLGDSENYVVANPMQTPPAIVPEWYLLPFYAVLRSIPNKLVGVICMFSAIVIILAMVLTDRAKSRGMQFKPSNRSTYFTFIGVLIMLLILGARHVETPFIELGQAATLLYFVYFMSTSGSSGIFELGFNGIYLSISKKIHQLVDNSKGHRLIDILNSLPESSVQLPLKSLFIPERDDPNYWNTNNPNNANNPNNTNNPDNANNPDNVNNPDNANNLENGNNQNDNSNNTNRWESLVAAENPDLYNNLTDEGRENVNEYRRLFEESINAEDYDQALKNHIDLVNTQRHDEDAGPLLGEDLMDEANRITRERMEQTWPDRANEIDNLSYTDQSESESETNSSSEEDDDDSESDDDIEGD